VLPFLLLMFSAEASAKVGRKLRHGMFASYIFQGVVINECSKLFISFILQKISIKLFQLNIVIKTINIYIATLYVVYKNRGDYINKFAIIN